MESYPTESYPSDRRPTIDRGENPSPERTFETDKPVTDDYDEVYPKPADETSDESASFFEAPRLFNPKDQTADRGSVAPVRTAVYHKPAAGQPSKMRNVSLSRRQAELDAAGWTSVDE
jgi:hypothetical protein